MGQGAGVKSEGVRIGVDIGGTFTDLQILDREDRRVNSLKTPTTPEDPSIGLMAGIEAASGRFGFALADIGSSCTAPPSPPTPCSSGSSPGACW